MNKLEGPDVYVGGLTFYLDGAISVFQTGPFENFKTAIFFHCGGLRLYPVTHAKPG